MGREGDDPAAPNRGVEDRKSRDEEDRIHGGKTSRCALLTPFCFYGRRFFSRSFLSVESKKHSDTVWMFCTFDRPNHLRGVGSKIPPVPFLDPLVESLHGGLHVFIAPGSMPASGPRSLSTGPCFFSCLVSA